MAVCQCPRSFVTSFGIIPNFWAVLVTKRAMRPEHGRMGLAVFWVHAGLATARPGRRGRAVTMAVVRAPSGRTGRLSSLQRWLAQLPVPATCSGRGPNPAGARRSSWENCTTGAAAAAWAACPLSPDPGHGAEGQAASESQGPLAP